MIRKYKIIHSKKEKKLLAFLSEYDFLFGLIKPSDLDFDLEVRKEMTNSLVKKINDLYKGKRIIYIKYETEKESYLLSDDDIVEGSIIYHPPRFWHIGAIGGNESSCIEATFNFNSNDPLLKEEYQGLAKIIRKELK